MKYFAFISAFVLMSCTVTTHPIQKDKPRRTLKFSELFENLNQAKTVGFEKIVNADWEVNLSGLVQLDHEKAKAANLQDLPQPIKIFTYVISHREQGIFLIDSGIESRIAVWEDGNPIDGLISHFMGLDKLKVHVSTKDMISKINEKISGVFLTHMHIDHIMGLPDIGRNVPIYIGPNEGSSKNFRNLATQNVTDKFLKELPELQELQFEIQNDHNELSVMDFFGDGSLYIIHCPGHTPGSLAFLINSDQGLQLVTGDTSHTKWGWENGVPPGEFTLDHEANLKALLLLKSIEDNIPNVQVHLGHQLRN